MALRAATRISFVATALLSSSFLMTSTRAVAAAPPSSFYDIKETDTAGAEVDFSKVRGKVVYAVNVASR
jgi:hypothetical protein